MQLSYAIVFVSDMDRSVAFYRDVLGLPLRFASPEWTEFATSGATLALHASPQPSANDGSGVTPAGGCHPGLSVDDLDGLHQRLVDQGVRCIEAPRDLHGTRLARYLDPDGMSISISQARK
jgi:lactoylglutathione lyase